MRLPTIACLAAILLATSSSGRAAVQDLTIERLATCQVSWLDAKDDPARVKQFGDMLMSIFTRKDNQPFFVPKGKATIAGLPVLRLFPESLGMGVGFSAIVASDFDTAKKGLEKAARVTLTECETSEGMRNCAHELAPKKTLMIMSAEKGKAKETLVGCYYYYEK